MTPRLMEQLCRGTLGYELVRKGFTLYELDDHSICLEHEDGERWMFTWSAPIARIREAATEYLRKRGEL